MILDRIKNEMCRLSDRQQQLAQYILKEYENAAFLTAAKLAEVSDVSEATVVRFAARMGYARYSELQKDLQTVLRGQLSQSDRFRRSNGAASANSESGVMATAIKSMRTDMHSIEQTLLSLNEHVLRQAVQWLASARRVYVIGTHSEYGIACYFGCTLSWIRDQVYLIDGSHNPVFDALSEINEQDVVVALSFPPYPSATVLLLDQATKNTPNSIAITDSDLSPLAQRASCCLYAQDEKLFYADNSAPAVSLLSAILALVSKENFEESSAYLKRKQSFWEETEFYYHQE